MRRLRNCREYTAIPIFRSATHFAKSMTQMPDDFTISQLSKAVQADDLERVRAMLQSRPDLVNMDAGDREHQVLHYAVYKRSPEMVRLLMQHGADARKGLWPIREATTAIAFALERGYDELAQIIHDEESTRGHGSRSQDAWPVAMAEAAQLNSAGRAAGAGWNV